MGHDEPARSLFRPKNRLVIEVQHTESNLLKQHRLEVEKPFPAPQLRNGLRSGMKIRVDLSPANTPASTPDACLAMGRGCLRV